jgi:hypothetical protein
VIHLNQALKLEGDWVKDQTGKFNGSKTHPTLKIPYCTKDAFKLLRPHVEGHEGLNRESPNSHYAIWNKIFGKSKLPEEWEAAVAPSDSLLVGLVSRSYNSVVSDTTAANLHKVLDDTDNIAKTREWSGNCEFVYQPRNGK